LETETFMWRIARPSALIVLASLALVTACSTSSSESSDSGSENTGSTSATVEAAKASTAKLTDATGPVSLPMPTEAIDPGDKKIMVVSCALAAVGCKNLSDHVLAAADAIGWSDVTLRDTESSPAKGSGYIQQAVQEGYDGIVLVSMVPETMEAAVNQAFAAGIPMTCVECDTQSPALQKEVMDVTEGGFEPGQALGDWIIAQSDGQAKVIALLDKYYPIVQNRIRGVAEKIKSSCPDCTYKEVGISTAESTQPGPPTWSSTLSGNPKGTFDYAVAPYDTILSPMANTARQTNRTELSIASFDLSVPGLQAIQQGSPTAVDAVPPLEYMGWASIDLVARVLAGKKPWTATDLPVRLATQENYQDFPNGYWEPNFDFKAKFQALWGVS
jgi:ribose transport system substrate-binding protein